MLGVVTDATNEVAAWQTQPLQGREDVNDTACRPRDHVQSPDRRPWIPPPPPLDLDTPVILPDLATLTRALLALQDPRSQP